MNKGITLVALIITIIILLILAGVALNLAINNGGLFSKTQEGVELYEQAGVNEQSELAIAEAEIDKWLNGGPASELKNNFIFIMDIPDSNKTYSLNIKSGTVDLTIDWGDGQTSVVTAYNDVNRSHTYASAGVYTIKVAGVASNAFSFAYETRLISLISGFPENMCPGVGNLGDLFSNCTNLTGSIPEDLFANCPNAWGFAYTFNYCRNLTGSIPEGLFANCTKASNFNYTFAYCEKLTGSIPEGLFANCPDVASFAGTFRGCGGLTGSIPEGLFANCPDAGTFSQTFWNCSNLTGSIPEGLFVNCPNVGSFESTFYYCTSLTGPAPELWNRINVTNSEYCFQNCTGLSNYASIPVTWK